MQSKTISKLDPLILFSKLSSEEKNVCFLHTGTGKGKSILAFNPQKIYINKLPKTKNQKLIAYISYDIGYKLYKIKKTAKNDLKLPNMYFLAFQNWIEFKNNKAKIYFTKRSFPQKINEISARPIPAVEKYKSSNFKPTITKTQYKKAYTKIQNYIRRGDIYQINLTHRLKAQTKIPARQLFLKVIEQNPVEFLAYIEGSTFEILSASPERFIHIEKNKIETYPIKGTRPRGKTKKEDQKMIKELLASEKEAAELNMITDLLRNDIGKVSKPGSVKVEKNRLLSKCPTVWHTYSKITGQLKAKISPLEALISMLPGGSITGCPKKRAMQIIDELEPMTRSVYTGVIGHIEPNGDLDFNIAIRTIIKKRTKLYLQVGGGIVIDSKEEAEYKETLQKAASFMKIL